MKNIYIPSSYKERVLTWFQIVFHHECGMIINPVGDHYYMIPDCVNHDTLASLFDRKTDSLILFDVDVDLSCNEQRIADLLKKAAYFQKNITLSSTLSLKESVAFLRKQGLYIVVFLTKVEDILLQEENRLLVTFEQLQREHQSSFLFFSEKNTLHSVYEKTRSRFATFFQNVIIHPIYNTQEARKFVEFHQQLWQVSLPGGLQQEIINMCGGNFWLLKHIVRFFRDNPRGTLEEAIQDPVFKKKVLSVWQTFHQDEQVTMSQALSGAVISNQDNLSFLMEINLILEDSGQYSLSIPVLKQVIKPLQVSCIFEEKNGFIYCNGNLLDLTQSEERLIRSLIQYPGRPVSREKIASMVWVESGDSYSDWALDRLVSRVRKKLERYGFPKTIIKTKKGFGYSIQT